jgi:uncharacterized protein
MKLGAKLGIFLIRIYQWVISPLFPPSCRYTPTCSQYGIEALKKYGFFKGGYLTFKRILRCRPGAGHGHDPVP